MPNPMPAAEHDCQLPLVPLKYADGAGQQCDGSTPLTFGPLMPDGETRATLVMVSGLERGDASVQLVQDCGRPEDAGRGPVAGEPGATPQPVAGMAEAPKRGRCPPPGAGRRRREAGTGRHGAAVPRRNDRKGLPVAELRRLERRAEPEHTNRQEPFTPRRYVERWCRGELRIRWHSGGEVTMTTSAADLAGYR
jgi:hypothetical protein